MKTSSLVHLHPYRAGEPSECPTCEKLRARLSTLESYAKTLRPYQHFTTNAKCIACGCGLFFEKRDGTHVKYSTKDDRYCPGTGLFRPACPPIPHMHRYCGYCGASWFEKTAEQSKRET